jgi:RNA polymerase sigma-70 factor (ECF subfamily)
MANGEYALDLNLVREAADGDSVARRDLAVRLLPRMRRTIGYLLGRAGEVDDAVQLAMAEIFRSLHSFRGRSSVETWADRIAIRTAMRRVKRERRHSQPLVSLDEVADLGLDEPAARPREHRLRARVTQLLQNLSPERRLAIILHLVLDYSVPEIATMTRTRPHTVRDRLKRARKQLREWVAADEALRRWLEGPT